jgi:hypothetical protein
MDVRNTHHTRYHPHLAPVVHLSCSPVLAPRVVGTPAAHARRHR